MIESAAYDLIKEEGLQQGIQQGLQQGILDNLEARFEVVPKSILNELQEIKEVHVLKALHRKSISVATIEEFRQLLERSQA